jgi:ABC-2 type transport system permease protein
MASTRHELREMLYSPLSYVYLTGFSLALAMCVFLVGDFYASDEASIRLLMVFLPWVALIFVPALSMRAWADSPGNRSLELMLTLPLGLSSVVAGKFLAGVALLLASLAFSLPFAFTVLYLGRPDIGQMAGGYIGAVLLLATLYALALFGASQSKDQVVAFVVALVLLFVVVVLGWDVFGRLLEGMLPAAALDTLVRYSPRAWLDDFVSGLVPVDGVAYLLCVIAIALVGTGANIGARRRSLGVAAGLLHRVTVVAVVVVAVAVSLPVSSLLSVDLDLTEQSEFTLHDGTRAILARLPPGTEVTLVWSAGEGDVPPPIKSHARRVARTLHRMADVAQGRLTVRVIDPQPDTDAELRARVGGVRRVPMSSGDYFYLGAVFRHDHRTHAVPYFDIQRDGQTEYDIALALNTLGREHIPKIGLLSPLLTTTVASQEREGLSFVGELRNAYDTAVIPFFDDTLPRELDVLVVLDASILKRDMLYAIDQFVMGGGSLVVMMDPYVRFNRPSNQTHPRPSAEVNDISDLLLAYGVRYLGADVVGDASLASPVADQDQSTMSFPFWLRLLEERLSRAHPVTAGLKEVLLVEPGALEWSSGVPVQALVTTTEQSGALPRGKFGSGTPRDLALAFTADGKPRVLAAAIQGPLVSAFSAPPAAAQPPAQRLRSTEHGRVFIVADVDWLFDPFALQSVELGGQIVVRPLNDNLAFFLNLIEYASGETDLLGIRSRGPVGRPFTRVQALFVEAEARYRAEESRLTGQIARAEERFARLLAEAGVESIGNLPTGLEQQARMLADELLPIRRQLRNIRRQIREEVEHLGRVLVTLNLLAGPVLALLLGVTAAAFRAAMLRRYP